MSPPDLIVDGPEDADLTLALAHGAGAPMDSPFMNAVSSGVAAGGFRAARFEFPYMRARRTGGRRGPPDREEVLRQCWLEAIAKLGPPRLVIGGKSLGGRIASTIADEAGVAGLVCLGYPFHPPGRPERLRTRHLESLKTAALIVQGSRDPFGSREEVAGYRLSPSIEIVWIEGGDHSFRPAGRRGQGQADSLARAVSAVCGFLARIAEAGG